MVIDRPLVFLDIESTGGSVADDRITEIGLLTVDDGRVTREWSSLINPERTIPPFIARYIGIDDEMVADAPRFAEIADQLLEMIQGRLLVAHNARFDYSFLRHEFRLSGHHYHADLLCTVKLSRRLYPQYQKHNLDSLISRHKLTCEARHRAFGDAAVLWDFLQLSYREHDGEDVTRQIEELSTPLSLPPQLAIDALDDLPETAGVYQFFDAERKPLLVGKAKNLRAKVIAQLAAGSGNRRSSEIQQRVVAVEWLETVGIIGAELEEIRLVEALSPAMNSAAAHIGTETLVLHGGDDGNRIEFVPAQQIAEDETCFGLFRNREDAISAIQAAVRKQPVCIAETGLEGLRCPVHSEGVCPPVADPLRQQTELRVALARLREPDWPFGGRVVLREQQSWPEKTRAHLFDHWCYVGYADDEPAFQELVEQSPRDFDLAVYRLLKRLLEQPKTAALFQAL